MIYSFLNQKGGVGKTTLSLNVAAVLARSGSKVLLIDADPQGTASQWAGLREEAASFRIVNMARDNMAKDAMAMAADYDHTIIDGPPRAEMISRSVIISSDVVVLPIEPSGFSTWASNDTVEQIRQARQYKEALISVFLVSRKIEGTVIGRDIRELAAMDGFPVLDTEIMNRVAFAEAGTMAKTILEYAPTSKAATEIGRLALELLSIHEQEDIRSSTDTRQAAHA